MQTAIPYNGKPRVQAFATVSNTVEKNSTITLYGKGLDQETKDLTYTFIWPGGQVSGLEKTAEWTAPDEEGVFEFKLIIEDEDQQTDTAALTIEVVAEINIAPEILKLTPSSKYIHPGGTITFEAEVTDQNNDPIVYAWSSTQGEIIGSDDIADWLAPNEEGITTVTLNVSDGRGGTATASIKVIVLDSALFVDGDVVAWYPFDGNAQDISGHMLHGQVFGAKLSQDSLGNSSAAYFFDGVNDHIRVANSSLLNFDDGITVTAFARPGVIGDKERFILSHGSWQNRWKLSITPDRKVRWTVKNTNGQVRDLDSETVLEPNTKTYHIGASYDGRYMMIYLNGHLENFTPFNGNINSSPVDLEIGQILPDDAMYNYSGILDEIKIFDYALRPDSVASESGMIMTGIFDPSGSAALELMLSPNPAEDFILLNLPGHPHASGVNEYTATIYDAPGIQVWMGSINTGDMKIDRSSLNVGFYVVQLQHKEAVWTTSFVIEKQH
jgi:hypothetical protein